MAAIVPRAACALLAAHLVFLLQADESSAALSQINRIAESLAANDPYQAMAPFDKSYPDYRKLESDFIGLTNAYDITSEATVVDEKDSPAEVKLTLNWTLTLTQANTSLSKRRTSEIQVVLVQRKGKWRIVKFSPIQIFDPAISQL